MLERRNTTLSPLQREDSEEVRQRVYVYVTISRPVVSYMMLTTPLKRRFTTSPPLLRKNVTPPKIGFTRRR